MTYYIHKNGRNLGPMDEATVNEGLACGRFSLSDLACEVGGANWQRLGDILHAGRAQPRSAPAAVTIRYSPPPPPGSLVEAVAERISSAAGLERIQGFSLRSMFAEVFRKRSNDEIESYFSAGAPETTPRVESIPVYWPQPWAFVQAFFISISAFAAAYFMATTFKNPNAIPAVLMFGAFAVPSAVLVLFFEFNILRNISPYQIGRLVMIGGCLSLVVSLFLFGWASNLGLDWLGASVAGIVEETGKLLAMLIVAGNPRYRWTLNGLLIGACIGTGFAVVETAGYAFRALMRNGEVESVLFLRGWLYLLGGHGLLSAVVGGALWKVKGSAKFSIDMLSDPRFLRLFFVSVTAHMFWNSQIEVPFYGKYAAVGFVLWVVILSLVQSGLKQVRYAQKFGIAP